MSIVNDRIRESRIKAGLTLLQVANKLGVKEATVQRYESGEIKNIKHGTITQLAEMLHCSPTYLMGWDNTENTDIIKKSNSFSISDLDTSEKRLIESYRILDTDDKAEIRVEIRHMLKAPKYKKNTSIAIEEKPELPNIDLTTETKENMTNPPCQEDSPSRYPLTYFDDLPVSAGSGFYSMDIANSITIDLRTPPPKGASYMVKVTGDSMQPTIKDGDKIFIKNDKCIKVGEIGIFILNSDFYVKELGEGCLLSHNPKFPPIPIREGDNIVCRGKFIGICKEDFK